MFPVRSNTAMENGCSSENALGVARGVSRLLIQEGYSPILEFTLANGRRLDVAALGADGTMVGDSMPGMTPSRLENRMKRKMVPKYAT